MTTFTVTSLAHVPTVSAADRIGAHIVRFTDTELAFIMCVLAFASYIDPSLAPSARAHRFLATTWGMCTHKGRPHYNTGKGRGHAVAHLTAHHGALGFGSATEMGAAIR